MTEDESRKVSQHCIDAWPAGPKAYIWRELVAELEYGPAVGAYRALLRKAVKTPTVGAFMAEYNNLHQPTLDARGIRWDGNEISLGEYLERTQLKATAGSHEAQAEMDRWQRHLTGQHQHTHR